MPTTGIRISPEAISLIEELDRLGLAYGAQSRWGEFIDGLLDQTLAQKLRRMLDDLQQALVYTEGYEPIAIDDLPWKTIAEIKAAHRPEPAKPEPAQTRPAAEIEVPRPDARADRVFSRSMAIALLEDRLKNDAPAFQKRFDVIKNGAASKNVVAGIMSVIDTRQREFLALVEKTKQMLAAETADRIALDNLEVDWRFIGSELNQMESDLRREEILREQAEEKLKFPFPSPREGQMEAVEETLEHLIKSDVVACAPTGFGKSAYALAAASGFKSGAYVITPQRVLVEQYKSDFAEVPWVGFLKSRHDFHCVCDRAKEKREGKPQEEWPTCSDMADGCDITKAKNKDRKRECPYVQQRDEAMSRPVVVMTAAMATTLMLYRPEAFPRRAMLIVDESQRLEDTLMSACTSQVKFGSLVRDGWTMENDGSDTGSPLIWPLDKTLQQRDVKDWLERWMRRAQVRLDALNPADLEGKELKEYRRYDSLVNKLKMAFMFDDPNRPPDKRRPHAWIHIKGNERFKVEEAFEIKPLAAIGMLDDVMGGAAVAKLLVSATPGTPEMVQDTLGLRYEPTYLEYGSPFPVENREVREFPIVRLNYNSREEDYEKMMQAIVMIASAKSDDERENHAGTKGIIHSVSNQLHDRITKALRRAELGWRIREIRGSFRRLEILDEFQRSDQPLILIGPAVTDGVSLKDGQCRWGIIPKLPWPPIKDPSVEYRKGKIPDWYVFQVVLTVIQACGRNVRSKDDWGINYVLDAGFDSLVQRNGYLFPSWFLQAIRKI